MRERRSQTLLLSAALWLAAGLAFAGGAPHRLAQADAIPSGEATSAAESDRRIRQLPGPFTAYFDFYRNGKLIGEARFELQVEGENWTMTTESDGTRGLAKFLGVSESSVSRGTWSETGPVPLGYEQTIKVSFKKIENRADFDWQAGTVRSVHKDGEDVLPLEPGMLDPVSAGLAIRAGLFAGVEEWFLPTLDEDEIDEDHFRAGDPEWLDTPLGCLRVRRVEKIRAPQSRRYTRTYHAADLAWVPVYIEHGKTGDEALESRIRELIVDGQTILPRPGCAPDGS